MEIKEEKYDDKDILSPEYDESVFMKFLHFK